MLRYSMRPGTSFTLTPRGTPCMPLWTLLWCASRCRSGSLLMARAQDGNDFQCFVRMCMSIPTPGTTVHTHIIMGSDTYGRNTITIMKIREKRINTTLKESCCAPRCRSDTPMMALAPYGHAIVNLICVHILLCTNSTVIYIIVTQAHMPRHLSCECNPPRLHFVVFF